MRGRKKARGRGRSRIPSSGAFDLAEGHGNSERRRGARKPHRFQRVAGRRRKPRASAEATRSAVSSGHLICTKWTSSAAFEPRVAIAARTPSATARPARADRGAHRAAARCASARASAPGASGRPITRLKHHEMRRERALRAPGHRQFRVLGAGLAVHPHSCNARVAKPREKSLTRPLPSVLPKTATTAFTSIAPSRMRASSPETSSGALAEMRCTNARRVTAGSR